MKAFSVGVAKRLKSLRSHRQRALCAALVAARKTAGLSQHELALRLKTSQTVIARIEIGERRIDVIEFIDLARALRLDAREVLTQLMRQGSSAQAAAAGFM